MHEDEVQYIMQYLNVSPPPQVNEKWRKSNRRFTPPIFYEKIESKLIDFFDDPQDLSREVNEMKEDEPTPHISYDKFEAKLIEIFTKDKYEPSRYRPLPLPTCVG